MFTQGTTYSNATTARNSVKKTHEKHEVSVLTSNISIFFFKSNLISSLPSLAEFVSLLTSHTASVVASYAVQRRVRIAARSRAAPQRRERIAEGTEVQSLTQKLILLPFIGHY